MLCIVCANFIAQVNAVSFVYNNYLLNASKNYASTLPVHFIQSIYCHCNVYALPAMCTLSTICTAATMTVNYV